LSPKRTPRRAGYRRAASHRSTTRSRAAASRRRAAANARAGTREDSPIKVAIVGAGCAGLAAAWELSKLRTAEDTPRYDITVYEKSWRLGGKGASGRDEYGRIREHGIHIWLGFYENAFRMMRECYKAVEDSKWGPAAKEPDHVLPYGQFDHAFFPEPHLGVGTKYGSDVWKVWSGFLPPMEGLPGTPLDDKTNPFTLQAYLVRCLGLSKALIHSVLAPADETPPGQPRPDGRSTLDETLDLNFSSFDPLESPGVLVERMVALLRAGALTTAAGVLQGVTILETMLRQRDQAPQFSEGVLKFIEALATQARRQLRDLVSIDPETRLKTQVLDLIITIMVGLVRDRVLTDSRGLDAINDMDCKKWLLQHGAVQESVDSAFVTGLYDLAFCYRDGDREQPALAAGQALRGALRMFFSYRGAIFWRMRGGMGETVFSPLFRVLKKRNVRFKFLHSLEAVKFDGDTHETRIVELQFAASRPTGGFNDDDPLDHFGCWRHTPPDTNGTRTVIRKDVRDFDAVILAMAIDDFRVVCGDQLAAQDPKWGKMLDTTRTIATQAAQVWMTRDLTELGWRRGSVLVSALEIPFETWADMTHTLGAERAWRAHPQSPASAKRYGSDVKSIAYFCGLLPQAKIDSRIRALKMPRDVEKATKRLSAFIKRNLRDRLKNHMDFLWPKAGKKPIGSPLKILATPSGKAGGTLASQHIQASFYGSDRYTLAVPGSLEHRISPLRRLVTNMTIAGDWTECGFNEGCIEAAVMSGMLAAHAISGEPNLDDIIGYNHP
jgi:uncharacterized protein with NAD-binding domain and iron-sulfur cluster